ncbi:hypothetical protein [Senegalia sp. (in: firmicutes)]|uniref:hypothetical protein n=2 Tax=Senegalia sp. (in: firmicutes) TaxID=1924098 RepID=UPI003F999459
MGILKLLMIIFFVNAFILFLLRTSGKISEESTLYKILNMILVNLPLALIWIYILYLSTDSYMDLFVSLIFTAIIGAIMYVFHRRIKVDKYINSYMVIVGMTLIFIFFIMIVRLTSIYNMGVFAAFIAASLAQMIFKSKNNSENAKITAITMIVIFFLVIGFTSYSNTFKNYSFAKTKPERIADQYMIEKGYDLDNINHKNIDMSMIRKEKLNMSYVINDDNYNSKLEEIITMTYYKGKIVEYTVSEF